MCAIALCAAHTARTTCFVITFVLRDVIICTIMFTVGITCVVLLFVFCLLLTTATACSLLYEEITSVAIIGVAVAALSAVIDKNINSIVMSHDWLANGNALVFAVHHNHTHNAQNVMDKVTLFGRPYARAMANCFYGILPHSSAHTIRPGPFAIQWFYLNFERHGLRVWCRLQNTNKRVLISFDWEM